MGDIGKGTAVHDRRGALERLHQIGLDGVLEQRGHGAVRLQILGVDRLAGVIVGDKDIAQAALQIVDVGSQAEDRHDLGRDGDDKVILTRYAVDLAAQADDDIAQRAVVHIQTALDENAALVDAECVALLDMVVEHGAAKVVGGCDGVHVAGKVEVDVLHREHLCIAAAGCAALDTEHGTERRFAQRDDRFFADFCHCLSQSGGGGGFALASRCGIDCRNQDQLAVGIGLNARAQLVGKLCLILAVEFQLVLGDADLSRDLLDRKQVCLLCNFNI